MTEKEIKVRYKRTILGFLWVILNPLLQMIVMGFIFQYFVPVKVDNYFMFLLPGLLLWNFFSMSINKAVSSFVDERDLITKANFPRENIVLSIILSNFIHNLVTILIVIVLLLVDKITIKTDSLALILHYSLTLLWIIPLLMWQLIVTSGISLLVASLNVKYRDIAFLIPLILQLWFYATPIVYTLQLLPSSLQQIAYLNPMTGVIELFRLILQQMPIAHTEGIYISFGTGALFVMLGFFAFHKESPWFDDWL
jgi:ABC-type polysaccharide/polyol phosphate export permease